MENKSASPSIVLPISILVGLIGLGFFVYKGLKTFSDKDRIVTVKGLAEMNMTATSATIGFSFSFSGDNLQEILLQGETKKNAVMAYLNANGFANEAITVNNVGVEDRETNYVTEWHNGQEVQVKIDRYTISQSLSVPSNDVKTTEDKAAQMRMDLITNNLTCNINTSYVFPDLNTIKPQLIAESTKNARIAGEQFANDSQAQLGKIKTASQGQISIAGQYYYDDEGSGGSSPSAPYIQQARVVSTIVFFLE